MSALRSARRDGAMPLSEFPAAKQREIAEAVAAPTPPERLLHLGHPEAYRPLATIESRAWWEWHWARGLDPDTQRSRLPVHLRSAVIARDGLICGLCMGDVEADDVHIDHIYPVARGGTDVLSNLQVTHSLCNLRKGAKIEWSG